MFEILKKEKLNDSVTRMVLYSPLIAKKALPGQFVILRAEDDGERIPLTISDYDREKGTISVIFQIVGAATLSLGSKNEGETLSDLTGPLGNPTELSCLKKVAVIGGGVGSAIAFPIVKKLFCSGTEVDTIIGFRNKDLIILQDDFKNYSSNLIVVTDDGSNGNKGLVTDALKQKIIDGNEYDEVFAIGPLVMMKFVSLLTKEYGIKTTVSMNPIMIDGTGMCGGCRITVGGKMRFACVDGPDFDGHLVDFDETIMRNSFYKNFEKESYADTCNLMKK